MIIFYLASYTIIIIYYYYIGHRATTYLFIYQAITPIIEAPLLLVTFDPLLNFPMIGTCTYIYMSRENRLPIVLKNLLTAARAFSLFAEYPFYRCSFWAPRLQFWERDAGAPELL